MAYGIAYRRASSLGCFLPPSFSLLFPSPGGNLTTVGSHDLLERGLFQIEGK